MARRRGGGLTPEDRELWARLTQTAVPLHPARRIPAPEPMPAAPKVPAPATFAPPSFRIGQTAPIAPPRHTLTPTPAEHLRGQALRMDPKTHRRMTQGKLRPEARIDLHGMTLAAAHPALIGFLLAAKGRGLRLVLVITGKGRGDHGPLPTRPGALRHQVPHWLHQAPLAGVVQQVTAAHFRHGGEGAYYVYLRR